jgi:hypothetical protein
MRGLNNCRQDIYSRKREQPKLSCSVYVKNFTCTALYFNREWPIMYVMYEKYDLF